MKIEKVARVMGKSGLRTVLGKTLRWSGVLCLNYHRIGDGTGSAFDRALWSASCDDFDEQVRFLKKHFDIAAPKDLPEVCRRKRGRCVLITFDDGYLDNYEAAFPILKSHQVPATFFVSTAFLDVGALPWWDEIAWMVRTSVKKSVQASPWLAEPVTFDEPDRERAIRTLLKTYKRMPAEANEDYLRSLSEATGTGRYCASAQRESIAMTWDMVREMLGAGMSIGGHSITHPILAQLPLERQRQEILGCAERLRVELDEPMLAFSYPVGGLASFNADTRACLREAGVRYAFSYYGGFRRFDEWDHYDIRRIGVESYISSDWFRAMVTLPRFFARARR